MDYGIYFLNTLNVSRASCLSRFGCASAERKRGVHIGTLSAYRKEAHPKWPRSWQGFWFCQKADQLAGDAR